MQDWVVYCVELPEYSGLFGVRHVNGKHLPRFVLLGLRTDPSVEGLEPAFRIRRAGSVLPDWLVRGACIGRYDLSFVYNLLAI